MATIQLPAGASDILTSVLREQDVWRDFMEAFQNVMEINVEGGVSELERIRFLDLDADPEVMKATARMLGFDLTEDVLNMSRDSILKLVTQLGLYPDSNGTRDYIKFFGLLINGDAERNELWSQSYKKFYTTPKGKLLIDGGQWFKTTHIELTVTLRQLEGLELSKGQTLYGRVVSIFYKQAPINVVIERFYFGVNLECEFGLGAELSDVGAEHTIIADNQWQCPDFKEEFWKGY